jgi:hypothetical protein
VIPLRPVDRVGGYCDDPGQMEEAPMRARISFVRTRRLASRMAE